MTYEDWCFELGAQWDRNARGQDTYTEVRMGQWFYNFLHKHRPDIASAVTGSAYDPFYDDERIGAFMQHVKALW